MNRLEWFQELLRMVESGEYGQKEDGPLPSRQSYQSPVARDSYNYGYMSSAEMPTLGTP